MLAQFPARIVPVRFLRGPFWSAEIQSEYRIDGVWTWLSFPPLSSVCSFMLSKSMDGIQVTAALVRQEELLSRYRLGTYARNTRGQMLQLLVEELGIIRRRCSFRSKPADWESVARKFFLRVALKQHEGCDIHGNL
jgi:hypothetical protein